MASGSAGPSGHSLHRGIGRDRKGAVVATEHGVVLSVRLENSDGTPSIWIRQENSATLSPMSPRAGSPVPSSAPPPHPPPHPFPVEDCSVAGALEALGDVWSILVLRELFHGRRRFSEMQDDLGISRSVLAARLARLVDLGVIRTSPYQEPGDRVRHEYRLTRKGVELLPVLVALLGWGDRHVRDGGGPVELRHRVTGERVGVELRTESGSPVAPDEIEVRPVLRRTSRTRSGSAR
jgi:DNA-binding HxlR family transcriptional regulator